MPCFTYVVPVEKTNAQLIISQAFETIVCTPDGNRTHINRTGICHSIHWTTEAESYSAQSCNIFGVITNFCAFLRGKRTWKLKPAEKFFASFLYQILLDASCRLAVRALFRGRMACDNHWFLNSIRWFVTNWMHCSMAWTLFGPAESVRRILQ